VNKINFIFATGLQDFMLREHSDRRYKVMSHALCPVCEFSYSGGHYPDCPWADHGPMGHVFGQVPQPGGFTNEQLRQGYEQAKAARARKEEIRRDYGQNAQQVAPYTPNRAQRRAQAHAERAQAGKKSRNNPKRSK
jgi:hypothetical protein